MQSRSTSTDPSLCTIINALILALIPFIDALVAQAAREGRPLSPSLRRLACTLAGMRAFARLLGFAQPATQPAIQPAPPRAPNARRPRHLRARRRHTPEPSRAPHLARPRHPGITPEPTRTLEL